MDNMNIRKRIGKSFAVATIFLTTAVFAESAVIGNVNNSPYIQGDAISTIGGDTAKVFLTSGKATLRLAPESMAAIKNVTPLTFTLDQGSIDFTAQAGVDVTIESANGTVQLSSQNGIDAIAVVQDGEIGVMPRTGSIVVAHNAGDSISIVEAGSALTVSQSSDAKVQEVLAGGSGKLSLLMAAAAAAAAIVVIDEVTEDDDEDASPL